MKVIIEQVQRSPFNAYDPDWDYILDMFEDGPLAGLLKFLTLSRLHDMLSPWALIGGIYQLA